ncbi:MAG: lipoprotein [Pseudomonadota bacterium]
MLKIKSDWLIPTLLGAVICTLVGCGTKGPLYIPEQRYPQEAAKPAIDTNKIDAEKASPTQPTVKE